MSKITIMINAAFEDEAPRILMDLSKRMNDINYPTLINDINGLIRDINGNVVGTVEYVKD